MNALLERGRWTRCDPGHDSVEVRRSATKHNGHVSDAFEQYTRRGLPFERFYFTYSTKP